MAAAYLSGPAVPRTHTRLTSCAGKVPFESAAIAVEVAERQRDGRAPRKAYRCIWCGCWHLGSNKTAFVPNLKLRRALIRKEG